MLLEDQGVIDKLNATITSGRIKRVRSEYGRVDHLARGGLGIGVLYLECREWVYVHSVSREVFQAGDAACAVCVRNLLHLLKEEAGR